MKKDETFSLLATKDLLLALKVQRVKPLKEENKKWGTIDLADVDVLVVYGIGELCEEGYRWLKENPENRLVYLEDRLDRLAQFLHTPTAKRVLKDEQVEICYIGDQKEERIKGILWKAVFQTQKLVKHPNVSREDFDGVRALFDHLHLGIHLTLSDVADFGLKSVKNLIRNLERQFHEGKHLFGAFQNIPAIVCGASPSLDDCRDHLRKLENRAIIIAGGSALTALSRASIPIHFAASLDPDPPKVRFYDQSYFEVPFFYQNRLSHDFLFLMQGSKLLLGGSGNMPFDDYFNLTTPFDAGWHVGNMITAVACALGCDPIILVGMDGMEIDGRRYAKSIKESGERGNKDFVMGRSFVEELKSRYSDRTFIHASKENAPFNELNQTRDIKGMIYAAIEQIPLRHVEDRSVLLVKKSFQSTSALIEKWLDAIKRGDKGKEALYEVELEEEIVTKYLLSSLWDLWKMPLCRNKKDEAMQKALFYQRVLKQYWEDDEARRLLF